MQLLFKIGDVRVNIWESLHWIVRKHKFKTRKSLTKKHQQSSILAVPFKQSKARSNEWPVWASANHLLNINYFLHWYMFVCLSQRSAVTYIMFRSPSSGVTWWKKQRKSQTPLYDHVCLSICLWHGRDTKYSPQVT